VPKEIKVSGEIKNNAYEITEQILIDENLSDVTEQFKCKIVEWIVTNNKNNYRFSEKVLVPQGKIEFAQIANKVFFATDIGTRYTSGPKGWMLTRTGYLVRGKTGWLVDENGLYILKDGRRLDDDQIIKITEELRIGDKDISAGLRVILNHDLGNKMTEENYISLELFKDYGAYMDEVVFQAFQINICYKHKNENKYNNTFLETTPIITYKNCQFKSIGTDETGIPIVVTRVGPENAKYKIVIAGPHGNERIARFVVLETQRYFIENGLSNTDLALYFIPAMSPTLFFADARGLPFVKEKGNEYEYARDPFNKMDRDKLSINTSKEIIRKYMKEKKIYEFLTIPKLHDFMEKEVDGILMHDNIQSHNISPLTPKYGIDANRDFHNILLSTVAFHSFINSLGAIPENITVFMMHGYSNRNKSDDRIYPTNNINGQGAVYGSYEVKENKMYLDDKLMQYTDLVALYLFGYKPYKNTIGNAVDLSENYIFENKPNKYYGEWSQKLYKQGIHCYDIELNINYRQGTRGGTGKREKKEINMPYDSDIVINRKKTMINPEEINYMHFFLKKEHGRFVNINRSTITFVYPKETEESKNIEQYISLSFYNFLSEFYFLLEKVNNNCVEVK